MIRKPLSRAFALLTAALVSFSTASIAVAHGHAHDGLQVHASASGALSGAKSDDHHAHADVLADANAHAHDHHAPGQIALGAQDTPADHEHPDVTLGTSARTDTPLVAAVPTRLVDLVAIVGPSESARPRSPQQLPRGSPRASPRQPRAPPLA